MKKNVGTIDKVVRILLGIIIAALGYYFQTWWGLLAIIPFATAFLSFCLFYPLLGITTLGKKK